MQLLKTTWLCERAYTLNTKRVPETLHHRGSRTADLAADESLFHLAKTGKVTSLAACCAYLGTKENALGVELERPVPVVFRAVFRGVIAVHAGVVDGDVQAA